jgi:hydroxymethylbilane synthase
MPETIRIGTRASKLALWQSNHIADLLRRTYPEREVELVVMTTKGDKILDQSLPSIGGKGLFTEELEAALLRGDIDCAVHSLKDLPTDNPPGLVVSAIPERAPIEDVLVSKGQRSLADLPQGATIGTSSRRRAAQLLRQRPDLHIIDIRGNVPTRIRKALDPDSDYDATVLAHAGVMRLGLTEHIAQILSLDVMLPAPGQGAIGIQTRTDNADLFAPLIDWQTRLAVTAERTFLNKLGGGCAVPVAAHTVLDGDTLRFRGRVNDVDGRKQIEVTRTANAQADSHALTIAAAIGRSAAEEAIQQGANEILAELKT